MALVTCPECKREMSSQAAVCPGCGAPNGTAQPRRKKPRFWKIVLALLFAGFAIMVLIDLKDETKTKNPVKAQATLIGSTLVVTNLDDFEWPTVTIYVNGGPLSGYSAGPYGPVAQNRDLKVPLADFTKGDLRFNTYERKVNQVIVSVDGHDAPVFAFK